MKSTMSTRQLGKQGEAIAVAYLVEKGFLIREQNKRFGRGEVDIIAQRGELLLFIEVKLRQSKKFGTPESFVHPKQEEHYHQVATHYLAEIQWPHAIRFDIIACYQSKNQIELHHFEDAF